MNLDAAMVLDRLKQDGPLTCQAIAEREGLSEQQALAALHLLHAVDKVVKAGQVAPGLSLWEAA